MLNTRTLFRLFYPSGTRTLYVSGSGVDTNSGLTAGLPKRNIQAAIDMAVAGDRIVVGSGTYTYSQFFQKRGSSRRWITIESAVGATPIIDVSNSVASWDATKRTNGMDIQLSEFIAIYGLEIRGLQTSPDTNPSGIGIFRGSHHVAVWSCDIHDFPGGGVNCFYISADAGNGYPAGGWDAVDVFFNTIHATSKYSEFNTSGVSFYGGVDMATSVLDSRYGYRAVGNYIYDVICTVAYTPGGFNNVTDGNGISPDSLAVPNNLYPNLVPYLKRGLIEGNVIVGCGGPGVKIYNSKNIDVVNNTVAGNLRTVSPYMSGYSDITLALDTADPSNGVVIAGNVIAPLNTTKSIDLSAQTVTANLILSGTDTITPGNTNGRATGLGWFTSTPTQASLNAGMAILSFAPKNSTISTRVVGTVGYQSLGVGGRAPAIVTVGALEPKTTAIAFVATPTYSSDDTYTATYNEVY